MRKKLERTRIEAWRIITSLEVKEIKEVAGVVQRIIREIKSKEEESPAVKFSNMAIKRLRCYGRNRASSIDVLAEYDARTVFIYLLFVKIGST